MKTELADLGIEVVALSKDDQHDASVHKQRDGLTFKLLADPTLKIIRQYGVEHHKALNFKTGTFMIGGIPLALFPSFRTMVIPTSMLVDERGIIRWIDQSDDYRVRSDNTRVKEAISRAFGDESAQVGAMKRQFVTQNS